MKKRILILSVLTLILHATSWAYDFSAENADGVTIYYNISGSEATVTYKSTSYNSYSGNVVIPETITNSGTTYSVTSIGSYAFYKCMELTHVTIGNNVTSIGDYAFYGCTELTSVSIPNSATSIGEGAFYNCTSLSALTLEDGDETLAVTTGSSYTPFTNCPIETLYLGRNLSFSSSSYSPFRGNTSLTSLTIGEGVTIIPSYAFYGCTGLTSLTIPKSVTRMGERAFYDCDLSALTIEDCEETLNMTTSSSFTPFSNCTIETLYLGRNITYSNSPFKQNTKLKFLTIGNSVTKIGESAFYECTRLTSVTIPNSVTSIGDCAFCHCYSLTEIIIPNSVTSMGDCAFKNCTRLSALTIEDGKKTLAMTMIYTDTPFLNCPIETLYLGRNLSYSGSAYSHSPFSDNTKLKFLTIGNSVTEIGEYAFKNCTGLTEVTIGNSVTTISSSAFSSCTGLTSVTIEGGAIGVSAFYGCTALTELTFGNSVTEIGNNAFAYCTGLTKLLFPDSVTTIGNSAFVDCSGLTALTIGSGMETIGSLAFGGCSELAQIDTRAATPPDIKSNTFDEVDKTSCVLNVPTGSFNEYWIHVYWGLFFHINEKDFNFFEVDGIYYNVAITSNKTCEVIYKDTGYNSYSGAVAIPETVTQNGITYTVTSIGDRAFYGCTGLTSITLPNSIETIGDEAFSGCSGLTEITIPEWVTEIDGYAFYGCASLTTVNFNATACTSVGSTLQSEGENWRIYVIHPIFSECGNLSQTIIGNNVISLPDYLFSACTGLESITSLNPEPPTCSNSNVFNNVSSSTCVLYVPLDTKEAYSSAYVWENFYNIVEMDMTPVSSITAGGNAKATGYYTTDGKKVSHPQRGINIIRYSDGTAKKVLVK